MSRERYQARSKVVQKLGRDGLVEQNRATGQEQRVSKRDADISFGPERSLEQQPGNEARQRAAQKKKLVRTIQQEYAEFRSSGFEQESAISAPGEQVQEEYHAPMRMADDVPAAPVIHEAEAPRPGKQRQEKRNRKPLTESERREQQKRQHRHNQYQRESAQVQPEAVEIYREQVTEQVFPDFPADMATEHEAYSAPVTPVISEPFESANRPAPDFDRPASDTEPGETANPKDNGTLFVSRDTEGQSAVTQNEPHSRLRFDDGNRLKFEHERPAILEVRTPSRRKRTMQPENRVDIRASEVLRESDTVNDSINSTGTIISEQSASRQEVGPAENVPASVSGMDDSHAIPPIPPEVRTKGTCFVESRQRLRFETRRENPAPQEMKRRATSGERGKEPAKSEPSSQEFAITDNSAAGAGIREQPEAGRKQSRLRFEDGPRSPPAETSASPDKSRVPHGQRGVEKAEKRVKNAEKRLANAESKLPKKRRLRMEKEPDIEKGKARRHLRFEEEVIPQGTPPPLPMRAGSAALRTVGTAASLKLHREIRKTEHENVAVEGAHKLEFTAERQTGRFMRWSRSRLKSRPYRAVRQAEQKLTRERGNLAWQTVRRDNPQLASTPLSRWRQKRAIRRKYAATKRSALKQERAAARGVRLAVSAGEKVAEIIVNNKKTFLIVGALFLIFSMFSSMMTSCSAMLQGGTSAVAISTYPSEDEDMLAAEAQYTAMEAELQSYLDNYESTHDYDEYSYDLDDIEHDPYVLISMLTALHGGAWTVDEVQDTLQTLFQRQYTLTETVETEIRTRTVDGEEEEYEYKKCTVELENAILSHLPIYIMGGEQLSMYAVYIGCLGNRPDLFPNSGYVNRYVIQGYTEYEIPTEALEDETFAAMIEEAEKYLGYPYVWGGWNPNTSFDCSGFVSWVINHSGWDVGRLTAQGLHDICTATSTPHPGDLVFFTGTYDAGVPVTHVGLYVGDGWMIHAGDPISYCHFTESSYHMAHLYGFGHLPERR